MAKYKFSHAERFIVWEQHGCKCFWCIEPLELTHTTVDHIIPEHLEEKLEEFESIKIHYALPTDFVINGFENWVPAHSTCNQKKSTKIFNYSPAFIAILESVIKKGPDAKAKYQRLMKGREQDKIVGKLLAGLESETINRDEVLQLLQATNKYLKVDPEILEILNERVGEKWNVVRFIDSDEVIVSDGIHTGSTKISEHPNISWQCFHCDYYGPWNGIRCMSCGQLSSPYD